MSEKLPDDLCDAIDSALDASDEASFAEVDAEDCGHKLDKSFREKADAARLALEAAILRFASERAAEERRKTVDECAQMLDALAVYESDNGVADSLPDDCAEKLRSLLQPQEPRT